MNKFLWIREMGHIDENLQECYANISWVIALATTKMKSFLFVFDSVKNFFFYIFYLNFLTLKFCFT